MGSVVHKARNFYHHRHLHWAKHLTMAGLHHLTKPSKHVKQHDKPRQESKPSNPYHVSLRAILRDEFKRGRDRHAAARKQQQRLSK